MYFRLTSSDLLPEASDPSLLSRLSPSGRLLASVGNGGYLLIVDVLSGHTLGRIHFGRGQGRVTALEWVADKALMLGNCFGEDLSEPVPSEVASLSTIIPGSDCRIYALCYNRSRGLLAVAFAHEIRIWRWEKSWVLFDTVECCTVNHDHESLWVATGLAFLKTSDASLLIAKDVGIWKQGEKSLTLYEGSRDASVGYCIMSPNGQWLAATSGDLSVSIWPLAAAGPVVDQRRTFIIPTGQDWADTVDQVPIAFLGDSSVLTADPIGTIYVLSFEGEVQHVFSVFDRRCLGGTFLEWSINLSLVQPIAQTTPVLRNTSPKVLDGSMN
ncbi:hypothetical protein FRC06_002492 [Ceratobasidium sp. 370]|nr:hypothetical protein FRC06_002492 [Ceratobasidium sp. 370]